MIIYGGRQNQVQYKDTVMIGSCGGTLPFRRRPFVNQPQVSVPNRPGIIALKIGQKRRGWSYFIHMLFTFFLQV